MATKMRSSRQRAELSEDERKPMILTDSNYVPFPSRIISLNFPPLGFKLAQNGDIVLANYRNDTVVTLSSSGDEKMRLKGKHLGMERYDEWTTSPWDVLIDEARDQFIVSCNHMCRCKIFSRETGQMIKELGDRFQMTEPRCMKWEDENRILLVDNRHQFSIWDVRSPGGEKLKYALCTHSEYNQDVVKLDNERYWVTDTRRGCIFEWDSELKNKKKMFDPGAERGLLREPWGIKVDQYGRVVITETGGACVSVFSQEGNFHYRIGAKGKEEGQFMSPRHTEFDQSGCMYVSDWGRKDIQVFDPMI